LAESSWLDLYAGTGAVGIEALSRGARMVYFVESSKAAAELIAANLKSLRIEDGFQIVKVEAAKALQQLEAPGSVADFVFLDPPYSMPDEYAKALAALAESKLLHERSVAIAEHARGGSIRERRLGNCGDIASWSRETRR
jgi:16S rRNA (guanine966-N2)-methyltransferase